MHENGLQPIFFFLFCTTDGFEAGKCFHGAAAECMCRMCCVCVRVAVQHVVLMVVLETSAVSLLGLFPVLKKLSSDISSYSFLLNIV